MTSNISNAVKISNISNQTSEEGIRRFFGFCGKISYLLVEDADASTKSATIAFDLDTAAETALLINNTQLDGNCIHVKPATTPATVAENISANRSDASNTADRNIPNGYQFSQSEKPRTRILAEFLACGYHISDEIIEKGIEFDKSNGISAVFQRALRNFDENFTAWDNKHHVSEGVRQSDEKHHLLDYAKHAWNSIESYFEKALRTPRGLRLRKFYEEGTKDVHDVHNEARHLADLMGEKHHGHNGESHSNTESTKCTCDSVAVYCTCPAGTCHCNNCSKNLGETETHIPQSVDGVNSGSTSNGQKPVLQE